MHELSLAVSLVDLACSELPHLGKGARITGLRVRLARGSGVVPETLLVSFSLAAEGSPIEGATLDIDDVPIEVTCRTCHAVIPPAGLATHCPVCGAPAPDVTDGVGLQLVALGVANRTGLGAIH